MTQRHRARGANALSVGCRPSQPYSQRTNSSGSVLLVSALTNVDQARKPGVIAAVCAASWLTYGVLPDAHLAESHMSGLGVAPAVPSIIELTQEPVLPLNSLLLGRLQLRSGLVSGGMT